MPGREQTRDLAFLFRRPPPNHHSVYHRALRLPPAEACLRFGAFVAWGGVSVAYRVGFFARAAPHDVCWPPRPLRARLRCVPRQRLRRRPVRFPVRRRPESRRSSAVAGELLRRSVRPSISQPTPAAGAARRRLRPGVLRAQLRRQIFSADHARQRLAGSDLPGVLSGERHQGVFRQQHRRRDRRQWRALCRQRKRLCLSQGAARRLHLQRPQPVRAGAGRSHARHLARAPAT